MNDLGKPPRRILVIRHGALGDFVLSVGPFMAIRAHHLADHITLLTTPPLVDFAQASGLFNEVWTDTRPGLSRLAAWRRLVKRLRGGSFVRVYDLQTSGRSSLYFHMMGRPKPEWSGIARGSSHRHTNPDRIHLHTLDRQREQLAIAGISRVPAANLDWARADPGKFGLKPPFGLIVPGGSAHRPEKRWSPVKFAALAGKLAAAGTRPVVLGTGVEGDLGRQVAGGGGLDLTGQTDLMDIAELARAATVAVGNDTGPMHIAAEVGCPSVVLFSAASDPSLCAPRGDRVTVLRRQSLADLGVDDVAQEALVL